MHIQPPTSSLQLVIPSFLLEKDSLSEQKLKYRESPQVIDSREIQLIKTGTSLEKEANSLRKKEFQAKKEELHAESTLRYKNWTNTLLGERRKRLQAAQDKARILEEQRQKIDEAWAIVKKEEHRKAIERATSLQYNTDPNVRQLNSKLLLMKVIEEREKQIEYKQRKKQLKQMQEAVPTESSVAVLMDQGQKWQETREKAMQIVKEQRLEVAKKLKEKQEQKRVEGEREKQELEKELADALLLKKEKREKKEKQIHQFRDNLQQTIQEKQKTRLEQKHQEDELDFSNSEFNQYKFNLENRKKQVEKERLLEKQELSEFTSLIQADLSKKHDAKIQSYLEKLATYTPFDMDTKLKIAEQKRIQGYRDQNEYRLQKIEQKEQEIKEKQQLRQFEKQRVEVEAKQESEEKADAKKRQQQKEIDLMIFRQSQKQVADERKQQEKKEALNYAHSNATRSMQDTINFEEFVAKKIKDLKLEQRQHLIIENLQTTRDRKKTLKFPWEDNGDTFSRLGFL